MARGKKKQVVDVDKLRDIDAYDHADKQRANNPPIGVAKDDDVPETKKTYAFDPNLDPTLEWAGKKEGVSFDVDTCAIHIHESIKPTKLLQNVMTVNKDDNDLPGQGYLFPEYDPIQRMRTRNLALEFYQHGVDWTNRLIAGDSLVVMNSLLEKEGMAGQIQMVYIDPPYGIKYGSNFQPFTNKKDVKDKKDEDLSQEPEMIKAFRDTWELGIHSYLSYLRNRLLLVRELLSNNGSVFVQISDDNLHHVKELCDEIFGPDNFIALIPFRKKTMPLGANFLERMHDYIIWFAKDKQSAKYHQLYSFQNVEGDVHWGWYETSNGDRKKMNSSEVVNHSLLPSNSRIFRLVPLWPVTFNQSSVFPVEFEGKKYMPPSGQCWVTNSDGIKRLIAEKRIMPEGTGNLRYIYYLDDFPLKKLTCLWDDTVGARNQSYVVQTATNVIQRCMLMTTDPDDLVLDITCGSGTTAYVAEQWGRRWITCDTSRVALELAKERIMTATYDYYKLAIPEQGISSGFKYKTVPHITLKSIANNLPSDEEILYDQPEIDKTKVRVSGPFTVESLPAPIVKPISELETLADIEVNKELTQKQNNWREELRKTGIVTHGKERLKFTHVEPIQDYTYFQAEAETMDGKRAIICFGSEDKVMDARYVYQALNEGPRVLPIPDYVIFAAFQFGPEAMTIISEYKIKNCVILQAQMNADLMTKDLKKKQTSSQSFLLVGQPDITLVKHGSAKNRYKVIVNGFDYFNTNWRISIRWQE